MSEFIQLHILASYPPSNLNRDDLGRPKTAMMGGTQRLRVSSQSLKRAWRESDLFKEALSGHIGIRTKEMGVYIYKALTTGCSLVDIIEKYLFSWDEIPGNDNGKLIEYLNRHFAIEWVKTAEIEKIDDGRAIKVSTGINFLSLSLNDEKTKVDIKIDDGRTDKFIVITENGELNIYIENNPQMSTQFHKMSESKANKHAQEIVKVFGETESKNNDKPLVELKLKQLVHFNREEIASIDSFLKRLAQSGDDAIENNPKLLRKNHAEVDIAMFGRMLASSPMYNTEAAVQVSHAITVHKVAVEDDYFTAVDDLNKGEENAGAGHVGESEFASGLFYNYICINRTLLSENLGGDEELVNRALTSLVEAAAKVAPAGKQNSYASRAYASYIMAEKGTQQPRSLSVAFLKALNGKDLLDYSISALRDTNEKMEKVYGKCSGSNCEMNAHTGEGSLDEILGFVAK